MKRLYVIVHGIKPIESKWQEFIKWLEDEPGGTVKYYPHSIKAWSIGRVRDESINLRAKVNEWCILDTYDEIILIGHSIGGLLVRDAYLLAASRAYGDNQTFAWCEKVRRIVLLAAPNRGIIPQRDYKVLFSVLLLQIIGLYRKFLFSDVMVGSTFLTNLRLSWIEYFSSSKGNLPEIVQILGTKDSVVSRSDSIDLYQFPNSYQLDVPLESHEQIYYLRDIDRKNLLKPYITGSLKGITPIQAPPINKLVKTVIIILHGIRASKNEWVKDARELLEQRISPDTLVVDYSYGFFAVVQFVIPSLRHNQVRWFQDLYSDLRGKHPHATFHFIGHSNGTYMLGESLKNVRPGIRFSRVALAGSAIPRNFDWPIYFAEEDKEKQQVKDIQNHVCRHDWVIGFGANAVNFFFRDVGTGGYDGFDKAPDGLRQYRYYDGGHSRVYEMDNLPNIVRFILDGYKRPNDVEPKVYGHPDDLFDSLSQNVFRWILPALIVLLIVFVAIYYFLPDKLLWALIALAVFLAALGYCVAKAIRSGKK